MECLICYLALADLLASIINPTMFIYWTITGHRVWHFGQIGCVILPSLTRITVTYSFGIISVITIDRFRVICRPSIWQLKAHLTWVPASVVFILSILSDIPKMVYLNVKPGHGCDVNEHQTSGHYIYPRVIILIVRNILFILVFSTTLYFIYKELYGEEKITTLREQMNLKRAKKIVCLLITMAAIFIMLVFPRDIFLIIFETSHLSPPGIRTTQAIQHINSTLKVLHMCNCLSNPFIYAKLHSQFKRDLRTLMSCSANQATKKSDFNEKKTSLPSGHYVIIHEASRNTRNEGRMVELNESTSAMGEENVRPRFVLTRYKNRMEMLWEGGGEWRKLGLPS